MSDAPEQLDMQSPAESGVRIAFAAPPASGTATEVASGVWWTRLPLSSAIGHVNVYLLEDGAGWTLVDTGANEADCQDALRQTLNQSSFADRPITRVLATHFHPDHLGAAGLFADAGAELWTSRLTWLFGRVFQLDNREPPHLEHVTLAQTAGMSGVALAAYRRRPASDFRRLVAPLPPTYTRLVDGDVVTIGARTWRVLLGNGHAPEHVTLWSNDGLAITGDQILPQMTTNLSVHPSDPNADPVSEWIDACERLAAVADDEALCLPGHQLPFRGAATRCRRLLSSQAAFSERLLACLTRPLTAVECLPHVHRRTPQPHESAAMLAEMIGFLNHLQRRGLIARDRTPDGRHLWRRLRTSAATSAAGAIAPPRRPR